MRRDKRRRLPGLPEKVEHQLKAPLSDEQRRLHLEVMKSASGRQVHPFELLHELMDIYQHPALRPRYEGISTDEAIARCPKLSTVVQQLTEIKRRGEKVLIFAHRKPMQRLLATVIGERFGLPVDIINGDRGGADENGARSTRRQMIERFRIHPGFTVLVLSPVVAGLGLTLVEANHVIHYGRWWNPALEAQATDRVYRIGQTRPVHVYFPIAHDPRNEFVSFDEKLDRIIGRRRKMAEDFLTPLPAEQEVQQELLDEVLHTPAG
jgi:SNF2 family DNA or RNA helicase